MTGPEDPAIQDAGLMAHLFDFPESFINQEEDNKDQRQPGNVQGQTGKENDDSNDPEQDPNPEVTRIDLSEAELNLDKDSFVFDGSIPHPEITVSLNAVTLVKDSDYEVLYDE